MRASGARRVMGAATRRFDARVTRRALLCASAGGACSVNKKHCTSLDSRVTVCMSTPRAAGSPITSANGGTAPTKRTHDSKEGGASGGGASGGSASAGGVAPFSTGGVHSASTSEPKSAASKPARSSASAADKRKNSSGAASKDTKKRKDSAADASEDAVDPHADSGAFVFLARPHLRYDGDVSELGGVRVRHGTGSNVDGDTQYIGEWLNDAMHGQGTITFASGASYSGSWVANQFDGLGCYEWPDGSKYIGMFNKNAMHGQGVYVDAAGRQWEGNFYQNTGPGLAEQYR